MSYKWPFKDPGETLDYSIDWSRFLGTSATISAVVWSVETDAYSTRTILTSGQDLTTASGGATTDSIQNVSQTQTSTVATINIGSGVNSRNYTFYCTMTDTTGSTAIRSVNLKVRTR
jgi:hypothetical protein